VRRGGQLLADVAVTEAAQAMMPSMMLWNSDRPANGGRAIHIERTAGTEIKILISLFPFQPDQFDAVHLAMQLLRGPNASMQVLQPVHRFDSRIRHQPLDTSDTAFPMTPNTGIR